MPQEFQNQDAQDAQDQDGRADDDQDLDVQDQDAQDGADEDTAQDQISDGDADTTEDTDDALTALWSQVEPNLADHIADMSPQAREQYLLRRLASGQSAARSAEDAEKTSGSGDSTDAEDAGPVVDIPNIDPSAVARELRTAVEEADGEGVERSMLQMANYVHSMLALTDKALQEQSQVMGDLRGTVREISVPNKMRQLLKSDARLSQSATEGDIPEALRLLNDGEVKSERAALMLAAAQRNAEIGPKPKASKRTASEEARRKAKAQAANNMGSKTKFPGGKPTTFRTPLTFTDQSLRDMFSSK